MNLHSSQEDGGHGVHQEGELSDELSSRSSRFRRKPPKTGYRVRGVPKRYQDQVQLTAVLRGPYGKLRNDADVAAATAWTRHHWRKRATQLVEAGCYPFAADDKGKHRYPQAMSCPVTFVLIYGDKQARKNKDGKKQGPQPCNNTICPFCWARDVRDQWKKVDAAFFPAVYEKRRVRTVDVHEPGKSTSLTHSVRDAEKRVRSPFDLIRRVFTFKVPEKYIVYSMHRWDSRTQKPDYAGAPMHGMRAWLESRISGRPDPMLHRVDDCNALLEAAGPGGGLLESISFWREPGDEKWPWRVQVRQLILAVDGNKVPRGLPPGSCGPKDHHVVIPKPRRRLVVAAVARTLQYPYTTLLDQQTPTADVVEYLDVRRKLRLVVNYGRFRAKHT